MNTNSLYRLFALALMSLLWSCKEQTKIIQIDYISGEASYQRGEETGSLTNLDQFYSDDTALELKLEDCFVLLKMDSVSLILPKEGKTSYTMADILKEFKYCEQSVNQKYLGYIAKNIRKSHDEPKDDLQTTGIVSRGTVFAEAKAPSGSCSMYSDSIHFAWNTNMLMDSLRIIMINEEQQVVGEWIIEPGFTDQLVSRSVYNLREGGNYFWQVIRVADSPSYNAWRGFEIASMEEIDELNEQLKSEFGLSNETLDLVLTSMSCGCD